METKLATVYEILHSCVEGVNGRYRQLTSDSFRYQKEGSPAYVLLKPKGGEWRVEVNKKLVCCAARKTLLPSDVPWQYIRVNDIRPSKMVVKKATLSLSPTSPLNTIPISTITSCSSNLKGPYKAEQFGKECNKMSSPGSSLHSAGIEAGLVGGQGPSVEGLASVEVHTIELESVSFGNKPLAITAPRSFAEEKHLALSSDPVTHTDQDLARMWSNSLHILIGEMEKYKSEVNRLLEVKEGQSRELQELCGRLARQQEVHSAEMAELSDALTAQRSAASANARVAELQAAQAKELTLKVTQLGARVSELEGQLSTVSTREVAARGELAGVTAQLSAVATERDEALAQVAQLREEARRLAQAGAAPGDIESLPGVAVGSAGARTELYTAAPPEVEGKVLQQPDEASTPVSIAESAE